MHEVDVALYLELALGLVQQVVEAVEGLLAQRIVERAQAALDEHAARHDVPRAVARDVADRGVALDALVLETLDDAVQPLDEERLRGQHVAAATHHPAVAARSGEPDVECVGARPHQARPRDDGPRLHEADHVQPDDDVGAVVFEQPSGDHRLRALDYLLGRLEDEDVLAVDVPDPVDQGAGDADHDRHVSVVAARVHVAVDARLEVDAGLFLDGQGVDVSAQHHRLAGPACVEQRDGPRLGRAGLEVEA